ncbi:MAG: PKD domain-containing protein, partial [Bacteroidales bacterium]|nr:PKD domain-containing protein [Bacteroidales bacterium]
MRSLLFFLAMIVSVGVFSQQLIPINAVINNDLNNSTKNKTMTCGIDTNGYLMSKVTGLSALSINNATSAQAFCQYFDAPQNLTVSGADFYAWSSSLPTVPVTVNLYYANPLDSTPTGSVLATVVVNVDSTFGAGTLSVLKKSAVFPTPVTVNAPYVIEITNYSANALSFVGSSYAAADGQGEWLCSLDLFGTWLRSYNVNVGGTPYNADFIVEPYITYDFTAGYDEPTVFSCYDNTDNIQFSEKHPLIENRMYSVAAFIGSPDLSYTWDFGDGSLTETSDTVQHTYSSFGTYTVIHTDTLFGFTSTCVDTTSIIITLDTLMADFSYMAIGGLSVNFTDLSVTNSTTGVISWFWDFGDGNTSAQQNPTHNYAVNGTYTVCLIASNTCEADTTCSSVTVSCLAPNAAFSDSTNNLTVSFTDLST